MNSDEQEQRDEQEHISNSLELVYRFLTNLRDREEQLPSQFRARVDVFKSNWSNFFVSSSSAANAEVSNRASGAISKLKSTCSGRSLLGFR